jgi:hypothetical protein
MMAAMKHAIAIILLCLPAQISAGGRCTIAHADRDGIARAASAKPNLNRESTRAQKIRPLRAWQRSVLFEMQIL